MQLSDRIGRRIKLQDLHVLMAVVQAGSMSKAAALLNTGQSAVSRSVAELERAIGVPLLERNAQGVELTDCGRALRDGGTAVFDDLRQAVRNIEFLVDPTAGEIRIGCIPFLAAGFVSAVIDRLSRRFPRIVFHLVTAFVETLHRDLRERNIDVVVTRRFGPILDERLDFTFLFDDFMSSRRAREVPGRAGAASRLPSLCMNRGCCHLRKACFGRWPLKLFESAGSIILARPYSPLLRRRDLVCWRAGAFSRSCRPPR